MAFFANQRSLLCFSLCGGSMVLGIVLTVVGIVDICGGFVYTKPHDYLMGSIGICGVILGLVLILSVLVKSAFFLLIVTALLVALAIYYLVVLVLSWITWAPMKFAWTMAWNTIAWTLMIVFLLLCTNGMLSLGLIFFYGTATGWDYVSPEEARKALSKSSKKQEV